MFLDKSTGEVMPIWLPPTPPAESTDDFYVDIVLDMAYDTSSTISPAELAFIAPYSEEDYDVLGLSRRCPEIEPIKVTQKSTSKQSLREHVNVPPSLFWRRYSTDTLSTKLKKLASHQKKLKAKDQFTPLLEQQPEGPVWSHFEDWLLLKGVNEVLEFPLSLAITVPAQMPNWSIIADFISLLSKVRRSPLQCREHLMNVVIPREDSTIKGDDSVESKKHKTKDNTLKKSKSRKDHKTKHFILGDGGREQSTLFSTSFDRILEATTKRKQATKFTLDSVQKPSTHADLLKDYGVLIEAVLSPVQIAYQRAERIQSELPRHSSQVHQLLAQPYHLSLMRGYAAAAAAAATPFIKTTSTGYNIPRQVPSSVAISTVPSQRFQPVSSAITSFTSSQLPQVTSTAIPSPVVLSTTSFTSPATAQPSTPAPPVPAKAFNVAANVSDISKTLRGNITHQQLLLLRQSTLQQQANANRPQSSTQLARPLIAQQQTTPVSQTPSTSVTQKVTLPSGIDQLRASIALTPQQRFAAITSISSNSTSRGLTAGRTLQTEDVLALLKQQSLRITQSYKTVPSQLHSQTHFHFRPEPSHLPAKIQQLPTNVVSLEPVKLASTPTSSTTPLTDVVQAPQKTETVDQNQGGVSVLMRQQSQTQSLSMPMQLSAPPITTVLSLPSATHSQTSGSVTPSTQNLVKAQIQQVLSQQQVMKTAQAIQLPKSTA